MATDYHRRESWEQFEPGELKRLRLSPRWELGERIPSPEHYKMIRHGFGYD